MRIEVDDLSRPEVLALLSEHLQEMHAITPPGSVHALSPAKLTAPDITFWTVWSDTGLIGCGALKELTARHGEVKSMRTPVGKRRQGAGRFMLTHIITEARRRGYERLSLETGTMQEFAPALSLYESFGFEYCDPFGAYSADPNSHFMTLELSGGGNNCATKTGRIR